MFCDTKAYDRTSSKKDEETSTTTRYRAAENEKRRLLQATGSADCCPLPFPAYAEDVTTHLSLQCTAVTSRRFAMSFRTISTFESMILTHFEVNIDFFLFANAYVPVCRLSRRQQED